MKLLIVTLNGVVRRTKSGAKFINHPEDQVLIPEMIEVLHRAKDKGFTIVGVSNEGGVEFCHKTLDSCVQEQKYTLILANGLMDAIYFAPYLHQGFAVYHKTTGYSQFVKQGYEYVKRTQALNGITEDTYVIQHKLASSVFRLPDIGLWIAMAIDFHFHEPVAYSRQLSIVLPEKVCMVAVRADYLFAHKLGFDCYDAQRWLNPKKAVS